jgi:hypothetical protein
MPRFIVRFIKDVVGDNGQIREVCQTTIELDARNAREAEREAKQRFCDMHATHDWSLHADRLKVDPADFPS